MFDLEARVLALYGMSWVRRVLLHENIYLLVVKAQIVPIQWCVTW